MIDAKIDMEKLERFHISGTPSVLQAEIAEIIGIVYQKIKGADEDEGELFKACMAHLVEDKSPVWRAPYFPGETTVMMVPKK